MDVERGLLIVRKRKNRGPLIIIRLGEKEMNVRDGEVSKSVLDRLTELADKEVEFERVGGQPTKIREIGGSFIPPGRQVGDGDRGAGGKGRRDRFETNRPKGKEDHGKAPHSHQGDFHNPYNFVPAPPRNVKDPDLGDCPPVDQDKFLADRYTGSIRVRMTVKTPLLVPGTEPEHVQKSTNGHQTYPLRVDADGKPLIPASSVRGMLRCAYEAITNSRFGRFSESHKQKHKYRESQKPYRKVEFPASVWDLLDESLRPATAIDELSPADRVFGWVKVDGKKGREGTEQVAVRGLLRVGRVRCESSKSDAAELFPPPGIPLAILSTPKPQQGRFYVAKSKNGEAQEDRLSKQQAGYSEDKALRGRKVYPHQKSLPKGYWENPTEDRTQQAQGTPPHYKEFRRLQEKRDDQNRSILGWVKLGARFSFDLHVLNLSEAELGAMLWLLTMPEDCFLRFGSGKPFGFGSVRLEIESSDLRNWNELRDRYTAWHQEEPPKDPRTDATKKFKDALARVYSLKNGGFDQVSFIKAFLTACRGYGDDLPVRYPRTSDAPNPDGESYRWFVANERKGAQYALPNLTEDQGLPTLQDGGAEGR